MHYANENYKRFIRSNEWQKIRERIIHDRRYKCEKCGFDKKLHVHHVTYIRFGGNELDEDLKLLCKKCHKKIHGYKNKKHKSKNIKPYNVKTKAQSLRKCREMRRKQRSWVRIANTLSRAFKDGRVFKNDKKSKARIYAESILNNTYIYVGDDEIHYIDKDLM